MAKKFLSREEYVNQQRQAIIDKSLENSRNRVLPTVPLVLKKSEKQWREDINNLIEVAKSNLNFAIRHNKGENFVVGWQNELNKLNDELNKGYTQELCAGDSCIYTATDNYGKKYRVSGNQSFRANPAKYGFEEINLNDIKPGDIIQDFNLRDNIPHHAITFIGYDNNNNKALFNYSKGGSTERDIVKNGYYPFYLDHEIGMVDFDGKNNNKLRHSAAAYRFIGTEDDNKLWNENYNKERSNWSKQVVKELKQVPIIQLPNKVISMKKYGGKQNKNSLQVKNGIAQPLGKRYYLMSGATHEQGGIDIGKNLEVENGEIIKLNPKSIKVLSNAPIMGDMTPAEYALGGLKDGTFEDRYNKGFKYQEKFKDINGLNDDGTKARFGKILNKLSNFYWHTLRAPKDYSEEIATLRNGCTTTECAKWSNDQLQKAGLSIFGDAWTRSSNKGIKKIYSGYDVSKRPKQYNKEEVINYTLGAADSLSKTLDINQLKQNDIVGLYFRNSPNIETAYNKGTNGETQTHTGHIVIDEDGTPFVMHNVHGEIVKNKAEDLIGSKHPYGITSVYRKELGGQMKNKYKFGGKAIISSTGEKKKAYVGIQETLNKFGQYYLYPSVTPAISITNNPNKKSVGEVINEYGRHYLHQPEFQIEPFVATAERIKKDNIPIIDYNDAYLWKAQASTRGNVPYPYRLEEEVVLPEVKSESFSNQTQNNNVTTSRVQMQERTTPTANNNSTPTTTKVATTPIQENTKSFTPTTTNNFRSLNLDFLNEITNPNGSTYNVRAGQTYFKDWNKVRRTPYSSLNLKTGKTEYAGFINPYGSKIKSAVYNNGPQGRQERTAEERLINVGDWINLGTNVLGAIGNLAVRHGYRQDPIVYPATTPISPVKLKTRYNINPQLQKLARTIDKYKDAIAKNTASSQTSLNRLRNLNLEELDRVNYLYGEKYNREIPLINADRMNFQNVMEKNIGRQEAVDRYNIQSRTTTNNLNKMERAAALVDFAQAIPQISENFVGTIEKRNQFNKNLATIGLGYPDIDVEKLLSIIRG